jgi:hypothetical protein
VEKKHDILSVIKTMKSHTTDYQGSVKRRDTICYQDNETRILPITKVKPNITDYQGDWKNDTSSVIKTMKSNTT